MPIKGPIKLFGKNKNVPMKRSRRRVSAPVTKSPYFTQLDIPCTWNNHPSTCHTSTADYQYLLATTRTNRSYIRRSDRTPKTSIDQVTSSRVAAGQVISCPCLLHCKRSFSAPEIQRKLSRKKSSVNSPMALEQQQPQSKMTTVSVGTQTEPRKKSAFKRFFSKSSRKKKNKRKSTDKK